MRKTVFLTAFLLVLCVIFASCVNDTSYDKAENNEKLHEAVDISSLELSLYVELGEYQGLTVSYDSSKTSKGDAVWDTVVENSTVKKYPEEQVQYYFAQAKATYEYLAKRGGESYENILSGLGIREEDMLVEARTLAAEDLVLYALLDAENISLSESEKDNNFDKYVEKFVTDYGYSEDYVRENMSGQIYDSMLFDKLLERLVTLNEFTDISTKGE